MAGIGFVLRRLTQRDDLLGFVQGYAYSMIISSGPWLVTVLAIAGVGVFAQHGTEIAEIELFRIVIVYNFAFSLVFCGPLMMVVTRYLADAIFARRVEDAPAMLVAALALGGAVQAPIVIAFYGLYAALPPALAVLAGCNYFVTAGVWVVSVFLTALKDFRSIGIAFLAGMTAGAAAGVLLAGPYGAAGILAGFTLGLAVAFCLLAARVFAEYPYPWRDPRGFLGHFRKYADLAAFGLLSNLAAWSDKWVMWFAPEAERPYHGLISYPAYDGAMFLAYLTLVPGMALFIVAVETEFFEHYKRYYRDIEHHAPLSRIRANQKAIASTLLAAARNLIILQAAVAALAILLVPRLVDAGLLAVGQVGIFRFGSLGATFHALFLFVCVILSYFDLRRDLVRVNLVFLAANAGLTWAFLPLGYPFYGAGYFAAAMIAFLAAYLVLVARVRRLPYLTFVRQNASVQID